MPIDPSEAHNLRWAVDVDRFTAHLDEAGPSAREACLSSLPSESETEN